MDAPPDGPLMEALSEFVDHITDPASWWGGRGLIHRTIEHLRVSLVSVAVAIAIAVPAAMALGHVRRGGLLANAVVNIGRAVPSFAILALLFPISLRWGLGLGFWPTFGAMVLLAIPPMFTNAYTGIRGVEPSTVEAARAMGMRSTEVLWKVEAPSALPLIITGVSVAAVQVVATATLGGFFGLNSLGLSIFEGFSQSDDGKLISAAVVVAILAILTQAGFAYFRRRATPWLGHRRPSVAPAEDVELHAVTTVPT
ncbi:MAG: ABC transporter permease [Acidimicrobiales bacterium]